jgi:hypothetical protein
MGWGLVSRRMQKQMSIIDWISAVNDCLEATAKKPGSDDLKGADLHAVS